MVVVNTLFKFIVWHCKNYTVEFDGISPAAELPALDRTNYGQAVAFFTVHNRIING